MAVVSYAGHQKERKLRGELQEFNLKLGLLLAGMCGIFSSGMAFAIDAAGPMKAAALTLGVNPLYAALPSYVFIMGGGALVNLSYCFIRLAALPRFSLRADLSHPAERCSRTAPWPRRAESCGISSSSFTHGAQANIPARLSYVNWMLHMSGYVLFAGLVGLALGEWGGVGSRPLRLLWAGILVIIAATNLIGLGMAS